MIPSQDHVQRNTWRNQQEANAEPVDTKQCHFSDVSSECDMIDRSHFNNNQSVPEIAIQITQIFNADKAAGRSVPTQKSCSWEFTGCRDIDRSTMHCTGADFMTCDFFSKAIHDGC